MFVPGVMLTLIFMGVPYYFDQLPAIKHFEERVKRYWELHQKIENAAPPLAKQEPDLAVIVAHEEALAEGIRAARTHANEGDIFRPDVQTILAAVIEQVLSSEGGAAARRMILGEGNPMNPESKARVVLQVNAKYPSSAPLSSVPPSVLLKLPELPEGLEYRFVGGDLILLDSKAGLIVDILRNAVR
jgi:hypothetical protein